MVVQKLKDITMTSALILQLLLVPSTGGRYPERRSDSNLSWLVSYHSEVPGFFEGILTQPLISPVPTSWCGYVNGHSGEFSSFGLFSCLVK